MFNGFTWGLYLFRGRVVRARIEERADGDVHVFKYVYLDGKGGEDFTPICEATIAEFSPLGITEDERLDNLSVGAILKKRGENEHVRIERVVLVRSNPTFVDLVYSHNGREINMSLLDPICKFFCHDLFNEYESVQVETSAT